MSTNTPVSVTSVRFTDRFETIPRRIELDGISYDLDDNYKRFTLRSDEGETAIFDVTAGSHSFRLRQNILGWRLIATTGLKA